MAGLKIRRIHRAKSVNEHGAVSALCFEKPHAIDLKKATWTIRDDAVTCPACLKKLK